jgi:hypothetical protein
LKDKLKLTLLSDSLLSILVLLVLALLFFWRVPFQGRVLLPLDVLHTYEPWWSEVPGAFGVDLWNPWLSDGVRQFYPVLTVIQSSWRQGQIPFWNPHAAAGMPILAAGLHQALYPITVSLLMLLPVAQVISWNTMLHTFLGGLFFFTLLREFGTGHFGALFGAIAFMFGGSLVNTMSSLGRFPTFVWLPLLLWSLERTLKRNDWRWAIVGGIILGLQILAGHLQMVLYSITTLGLYTAYRVGWDWVEKRAISSVLLPFLFLGIMVLSGLGLTAVQLLPTAELIPQGVRSEVDFETEFSPRILLRLAVPDILGTDIDRNIAPGFTHEIYVYLGILSLFFLVASVFSVHRRLAWGFVGGGILIWLVIFEVPPIYQLFEYLYPSFSILGFHRAHILIGFYWAVAAGLGADWAAAQRPVRLLKNLVIGGGIVAAFMSGLLLWLAFASKYQARFMWSVPDLEHLEPTLGYFLGSLIFALAILLVCLSLLWSWQQKKINRAVFCGAGIVLLVADLFLANMDYLPAREPAMLYPPTSSLVHMQSLAAQEKQPYRIMGMDRLFWGDIATVFAWDDVQGYDSFLLKRYSQYVDLTGARMHANFRIAAFTPRLSKLINALNVKYLYGPRRELAAGEWVSLLEEVDDPLVKSERLSVESTADWIIAGWPQTVLLAPPNSRISYHGFLQYPAQLETAIAIDPEIWDKPGVDVLFEIYAQGSASPVETLLFSQRLNQVTQTEAMKWLPVSVDLSDFTDQQIILSFVTSSANPKATWNAGWAEPLIMDSSKVRLLYYGPNSIYRNNNYLPRAWIVQRVTAVAPEDTEAIKAVMSRPTFDPAVEAVVEGKLPAELSPDTEGLKEVEFLTYSPSQAVLKVNLSAPGLLVFSDIYYPGWNVYVDEVLQPIYATNLMMRGVYVPAGQHQLEFRYEPASFRLGLYISGITGLILTFLLSFAKIRQLIHRTTL